MENQETKKTLEPKCWMGIAWFAVVMLVMWFAMAPVQAAFGMYGVAITELVLLLMGILPAVVLRWSLKEVVPVKKPQLQQIFGTLLIWGGGYLFVMIATMILAYFFPQELFGTSNSMNAVFSTVPPVIMFVIVAITPAICEEVLHRGLIRYTFGNVKNKWIVVIAMGIIFGLFHMDPIRFLPTGILGGLLTYIMLETGNIVLPMLLHFVNNALSAIVSISNVDAVSTGITATPEMLEQMYGNTVTIGSLCFVGVVAPFLLLFGSALLRPKQPKNQAATAFESAESGAVQTPQKPFLTMKKLIITSLCSAVLFVAGIVLIINGMSKLDLSAFL